MSYTDGELIDELVDTYGGDFTYRVVRFEQEDGEVTFFERYHGASKNFDNDGEETVIDDDEEREELLREYHDEIFKTG